MSEEISKPIRDNKRPTIVFRRTLNKGISPREERRDASGKIQTVGHPGEFTEEWHKALTSHRPTRDPYVWATREWVMIQIVKGAIPISVYGMDALPANYPKEWREQIEEAIAVARPYIGVAKQQSAALAELEALKLRNAELERLANESKGETKNEQTERTKSGKSDRQSSNELSGTPS